MNSPPGVTVAVTDHAADRYRQRVRGTLDARTDVAGRVARGWAAGRVEPGERGAMRVTDVEDRSLVFVCRHDVRGGELVVITLWEEGDEARVPRRFTDALEPRRRS
ncbi:hypothetical protein [Capillimicrobium parvum]|uniref:Uncharacterized protein n=1 Tax=Capillimicrobium parvum TaxID=2884022 RepID=A0A9E6XYD1_9ACTN|nr:hypothetical protein [Capillimicrobium parvum]UGS36724.1 hypothetical protein DSM104329_03133 [Capillimicrobium parvum]